MVNKTKIIGLLLLLNSFLGYGQVCEQAKKLFENDLYSSKELREYTTKAEDSDKVFDAWQILHNENLATKTNATILKEVENNYQAIKNAGGYVKWKSVKGAVNFAEGLVNGARRYIISGEIINGVTEITRQVTLGNKTMTLKWKVVNGTLDFTSETAKTSLRSQIKTFLGIPSGSGVDAHHILSLGKCDHPVVQAATKNGYHPNIPESIMGLEHYDDALQVGLHQKIYRI